MQFGIVKLLLMMAAYSIWLAALAPLGSIGIAGALFCGTTTSITIALAKKKDLFPIVRIGVGGLAGAFLGGVFFEWRNGIGHQVGHDPMVILIVIVGTLAGSFLATQFRVGIDASKNSKVTQAANARKTKAKLDGASRLDEA